MQKAQHFVDSVSSRNLGSYLYQLLSLMGFLVLLLVSTFAFAEKPNPGMQTCPAGSQKYTLTDNDYTQLSSSTGGTTHILDSGKMAINIGITDSVGSSVTKPSKISKKDNYIGVDRSPTGSNSTPDFTDIKLKFFMPNTTAALAVKKIGVTIFDLDGGGGWSDIVRVTGTTTGGSIKGTYHPVSPTSVQYLSPGHSVATYGGYTIYPKTRSCTANDATCQASLVFDEEVTSVNVNFGNTQNLDRQGSSSIRIKLDSYCYTPPAQTAFTITKDDAKANVTENTITDYIIKVTNTGTTPLSDLALKDPIVSGLSKQSVSCAGGDADNICGTASPAATMQGLESGTGFLIPSIPVGKNYTIKVSTQVTAAAGSSVTNTATVSLGSESKSASDTNIVTANPFFGNNVSPPSCPSGHQMYYVGSSSKAPSGAKTPSNFSWSSGETNKIFTFNDGVEFKLSFTDTRHLLSGYPSYSSYSNVTKDAFNMFHSSQIAAINHKVSGTILNRAVSKYGFVVQDLDSNQGRKYVESLSLNTPGGKFSNLRNNYFQLSNGNQTVSGTNWNNCSTSNSCDFNVSWGGSNNAGFAANQPFVVDHGNIDTNASTSSSSGDHLVGYSDFYFCVAPTSATKQLTVIKQLDGERDDKEDQFHISVKDSTPTVVGSFITKGKKAQITSGTDRVSNITVNKDMSYTITEQVVEMDKGAIEEIRDIKKYDATYQCVANSPSTIVASGALNYNKSGGSSRSFTLPSTAITKDLVCTITNKKSEDVGYTFEGTIFNDNGGLSASSTTHMANDYYFNGLFEPGIGESGINITTSGVQVRLYDCASGNDITEDSDKHGPKGNKVITPVYDSLYPGHYIFTVPNNGVKKINNVCIAQVEPASGWNYVDTTPDIIEISGVKDNKDTIFSYTNNNFGEVEVANTALVLTKQQYVHSCSPINDYSNIADNTANPSLGFSMESANDIDPGQCIAYKITATNRGNVNLKDIVISDKLQKEGVDGATVTSTLADAISTAQGYANDRSVGYNGTITTQPFNLANKANRVFYFNTKYGE